MNRLPQCQGLKAAAPVKVQASRMAAHDMMAWFDDNKLSLTDKQYKDGVDLCHKNFNKTETETGFYMLKYWRPIVKEDDDDQLFVRYVVRYTKVDAYVKISKETRDAIVKDGVWAICRDAGNYRNGVELLRLLSDLYSNVMFTSVVVISLEPVAI